MLKNLVMILVGSIPVLGIFYLIGDKETKRVEVRHQRDIAKFRSESFKNGYDCAREDAVLYHKIYHEDCQALFCPR